MKSLKTLPYFHFGFKHTQYFMSTFYYRWKQESNWWYWAAQDDSSGAAKTQVTDPVPELSLCRHAWSTEAASAALLTRCSHYASIVNTVLSIKTVAVDSVQRNRFKGNNTILVSKMAVWTKSSSWLQTNYFVNALFGWLHHWRQSFLSVFVIWNKSSPRTNCSGLPKVEQRRATAALKSNCAILFNSAAAHFKKPRQSLDNTAASR